MAVPRSHRVYEVKTDRLLGEMDQARFARFLIAQRMRRGRKGVPGDDFGFPGVVIYVPDANDYDPWTWKYDAITAILEVDGFACIRPPTYDKRFVRRLRKLFPQAQWSDGKGELPKGWWVPQDDAEGVVRLLAYFFHALPLEVWVAHGECLGTFRLVYPGPPPKEYQRPDVGCDPLRAYLTLAEIRALANASHLVIHKPVGVTSDDLGDLDPTSEDFWLGGYGYDLASCYGRLGEPRWVNEYFGLVEGTEGIQGIVYRTDHEHGELPPRVSRWRNRTEMEREQARLVVALDSFAILRLHALPEEDHGGDRERFAAEWDRRKYGRVFPWDTNPWVWRLSLRRILP